MDFGLFSVPIMGDGGYREVAARTYDEWMWEVVLADRLGFREAWIAEHLAGPHGSRRDTLPSADLFICKAAAKTRRIRLGPAIRPIAFYQPVQVAIEATVCDHLTNGRYNFGLGSGFAGDAIPKQRGIDDSRRRERMHEAIDIILKCWTSEEPFDYRGEFYQGEGIMVLPRPLQKPYMPVGIPTDTPDTLEIAGRNGFLTLSGLNDSPAQIRKIGDSYLEYARSAGRSASRRALRVCRYVYVAEDERRARDDVRVSITPSIEYVKQRFPRRYSGVAPNGRIEDVTFDSLADAGVYAVGSPDTVAGAIQQVYDESGGFGTLLLIMGKPFGTRQQRSRSMRLFMDEVAPRLAGLGPRNDLAPDG